MVPDATICRMRVLRGTVVHGHIVVDGGSLEEGAEVTVLDESDEAPYALSPDQEAEIEGGDSEIERGEYVTAAQLLAEIARARG
jgi:hypothetical protein